MIQGEGEGWDGARDREGAALPRSVATRLSGSRQAPGNTAFLCSGFRPTAPVSAWPRPHRPTCHDSCALISSRHTMLSLAAPPSPHLPGPGR